MFTETQDVENEARRLMALSRDKPLKRIDLPEAICLAAGIRYGYTVLTENGGAYFAPGALGLGVTVWRAFEVLVEAWRLGLLGDLVGELKRYEEETLHLFRERDWEYVCRMARCWDGRKRRGGLGGRRPSGHI